MPETKLEITLSGTGESALSHEPTLGNGNISSGQNSAGIPSVLTHPGRISSILGTEVQL